MNKVIVSIVSVLLCSINSFSQELVVKSFEKSLNPMTVPMQKKDLNGFICPLVKVELPIKGVKFEGNIIDASFDVNEYLVYLSPNSKMMAIKCPGYKTLKVYFNDYHIPNVVSKSIYILDMELCKIENYVSSSESIDLRGESIISNEIKSGDEELWAVYFDKDKKAGFNNSNGDIFITAQFEDARSFDEGLAGIKIDGYWGFINKTGSIVIPCIYDKVSSFHGGNSKVGKIINEEGKQNIKYCLIDYTGKQITSYYDEIDYFRDDRALIKEDEKYGFVNRNGIEVIPPVYDKASYFSEGYAEIEYNGKCGMIDINGKEIINAEYDDIESSDYNIVAVSKNGKWGYLNMNGNNLTKFEFDDADGFEESNITVVEKNDLCGMINTAGKIVIPIKYDELDLIEVKDGTDYNYIDLVRANKKDKYGIIDLNNKTLVPFKYDYLDFVESNGLIRAEIEDKCGYINRTGEVIIDFKYEAAVDFCDGIGLVKKDGKWGGVNSLGEVVIPFIYEAHREVPYGNNNGLFTLKLNNKWGCLNTKGAVQIPFIYDQFGSFRNGRVRVKQGQQEFLINEIGKRISEAHPSDALWP